jgi:hypothetical protein
MHITIEQKTQSNQVARDRSVFNLLKPPPAVETIFEVNLWVKLSEEERAICAAYKLFDLILFSTKYYVSPEQLRETPDLQVIVDDVHHSIGQLTRPEGVRFDFGTLPEAQAFEEELKKVHLPKLKQHLTSTDAIASAPTTTFEL